MKHVNLGDVTYALSVKEKSIILKGKEIQACNCEESLITACNLFYCAYNTAPQVAKSTDWKQMNC